MGSLQLFHSQYSFSILVLQQFICATLNTILIKYVLPLLLFWFLHNARQTFIWILWEKFYRWILDNSFSLPPVYSAKWNCPHFTAKQSGRDEPLCSFNEFRKVSHFFFRQGENGTAVKYSNSSPEYKWVTCSNPFPKFGVFHPRIPLLILRRDGQDSLWSSRSLFMFFFLVKTTKENSFSLHFIQSTDCGSLIYSCGFCWSWLVFSSKFQNNTACCFNRASLLVFINVNFWFFSLFFNHFDFE